MSKMHDYDPTVIDLTEHVGAAAPVPKPINRQLYRNSPLSGSTIEQDYLERPDAFHNSKLPNLAINHEKPEHRLIIYLKASGKSNREIAKRTGYAETHISQVLRQPWAREALLRELRAAGTSELDAILSANAADSLYTLVEIRDNPEAKSSDRITAANSLLDRFLGKPTQHVEAKTVNVSIDATDIQKMEAELKVLEAEEKRLRGGE
jgi:hypothetical protein